MEKELFLCKCVLCVSKNEDSTFVSKPVYTRHRKRAQILSSQDDENIDQVEVHNQDFDFEFHENIIENIDDIEDFDDFDDLEIISDNEKEEENDDDISSQDEEEEKDEDEDDNIDKDEDDNSEDGDGNEDEMQIKDHII